VFEFLFEVIYEFRFTRWLLGAIALALIVVSGAVATAGGWAAMAAVMALALMPDVIEYAMEQDR